MFEFILELVPIFIGLGIIGWIIDLFTGDSSDSQSENREEKRGGIGTTHKATIGDLFFETHCSNCKYYDRVFCRCDISGDMVDRDDSCHGFVKK